MSIAIFDNDVLVNIFDDLYIVKRDNFEKAMEYFKLKFSKVWIPETVKNEFFYIKKRETKLEKIFRNYSDLLSYCPITISKNEILPMLLNSSVQEGEADGILQTQKAPYYRRYSNVDKFVFVSNDKRALEAAEKMGVETLPFTELRDELREGGIII